MSYIWIITARDSKNDLLEVLAAGANDYLAKPLDLGLLEVRMRIAVEQIRILAQRRKAEKELLRYQAQLEELVAARTQALAYAKGLKDDTLLKQLYLVRGRLHEPQLYVLNLEAILQGQEPDVLLESGDVIYVLPSPAKDLRQLMAFLLPSLQAIQTGALMYEVIRNFQAGDAPR
ncbi:MAG: hypothetical protein IGS03_00775 [Candidatus Sericytochromatia bacterium]|nr:hypothetical protein [Candidatus Sericytochromatia bacterium]